MSRSKQKGTAFETSIVRYLSGRLGDERIMRMPLSGNKDRGDIAGVRTLLGERVAVECKNVARMNLGGWITEVEVERGNADAKVGVVIHKRSGKGQARDQYVTLTVEDLAVLLGADREWDD